MNKEDLYPLIGKYLNGYKIVKIEEDPFVKGQINLWTDEWRTEYFEDKCLVKFYVRPNANSVKIYRELVDKENEHLKEVIAKIKKHCEIEIYASDQYLKNYNCQQELCHKVAHQRILDILKEVKDE